MDQFEKLAAEVFWHVSRLSLSISTEATIHKEFVAFVRIAKKYRVPMVYTNTNGTRLDEKAGKASVFVRRTACRRERDMWLDEAGFYRERKPSRVR